MNVDPIPYLRMLAPAAASHHLTLALVRLCNGHHHAALLVHHVLWLWWASNEQPVLRFQRPCTHPSYVPGSSLAEELSLSRRQLEGALDAVGHRCPVERGSPDRDYDQGYLHYWSFADRSTYYAINPRRLAQAFADYHVERPLVLPTDMALDALRPLMHKTYISPDPNAQNVHQVEGSDYIAKRDLKDKDISLSSSRFSREQVMTTAELVGLPAHEAERYYTYYRAKPRGWEGVDSLKYHLRLWKLNSSRSKGPSRPAPNATRTRDYER